MSDPEFSRHKADALLSQAAKAQNMADRGRLIDEALHWHNLAMEEAGLLQGDGAANDEEILDLEETSDADDLRGPTGAAGPSA